MTISVNTSIQDLRQAVAQCMKLMSQNYSAQFSKAYPDLETLEAGERLWVSTFKDCQPEDLKRATLKAVRESQYMPNVAMIVKALEPDPKDFGLPSLEEAFSNGTIEAGKRGIRRNWIHPVVWKAVSMTGYVEMSGATSSSGARKLFNENYRKACERFMNGELFEIPEDQRLRHEKPKPASKNEARKRISALKSLFDD